MEKIKKSNKATLEAIKEAEEDMKNPSNSKAYICVEELLKDCLESDEDTTN